MRIFFKTILFFIVLISYADINAQTEPYTFTNSKQIDTFRYEKIKGDPMFFKDWTKGDIIGVFDTLYSDVLLNYNGYTKSLEVKSQTGSFIELEEKYYKRVIVDEESNNGTQITFKRGSHPRLGRDFVPVLYEGKKIIFVKKFDIRMADHTTQGYGETIEFKRFVQETKYYLIIGADLREIKLSKKNILKNLREYDGIEKFMKKNKLKWKNESDILQLIKYLDQL